MFSNNMGQRTNRKRIRHRPNRAQRKHGAFVPSSSTSLSAASLLPPPQPPLYFVSSSKHMQPPLRQQQQRLQLPQQQPHQHPLSPSAMSIRYSYNSTSPLTRLTSRDRERGLTPASKPLTSISGYSALSAAQAPGPEEAENALARDLRVFGGVIGDEMDSSDLRGPMLDVVLGLFNGVDYDDETC